MADGDCDQLADTIRALGADHAAAGAPAGDSRNPDAQPGDRLVSGATAARNDRAALKAGSDRVKKIASFALGRCRPWESGCWSSPPWLPRQRCGHPQRCRHLGPQRRTMALSRRSGWPATVAKTTCRLTLQRAASTKI